MGVTVYVFLLEIVTMLVLVQCACVQTNAATACTGLCGLYLKLYLVIMTNTDQKTLRSLSSLLFGNTTVCQCSDDGERQNSHADIVELWLGCLYVNFACLFVSF